MAWEIAGAILNLMGAIACDYLRGEAMCEKELQDIWTVAKFFKSFGRGQSKLNKPDYQRHYEWGTNHVKTLLNDLLEFEQEKADCYRLGCIILHNNKEEGVLDVIDGQQRLVTLELVRKICLGVSPPDNSVGKDIEGFFSSEEEEKKKADENESFIDEWYKAQPEEKKEWIRKLVCEENASKAIEIVVLVVDELDEAFQLFDTQNSRGKSLEVPDFLKAYHINCMTSDEREKALSYGLFDIWKIQEDKKKIKATLENLFKIEEWSCRRMGVELTTDNMSCFYGFTEAKYEYRKHIFSQKDFYEIGRSFKAGEDFFWMIKYFRNLENKIIKEFIGGEYPKLPKHPKLLEEFVKKKNEGKGIDAVSSMYSCEVLFLRTVILYSNRFGYDSLRENEDKNIKILLAWSSLLRYVYDRLPFSAIEKLASGYSTDWVKPSVPMFMRMSHATELGFLTEMVKDVHDFGTNNEKDDGWHGNNEGYKTLKKTLGSLVGINDEKKTENPDTSSNG